MSARAVGPVLRAGQLAEGVAAAIRSMNPAAVVLDRGAYLRVEAPSPCRVTREAIERELGRRFELPSDLEGIMPSFAGKLQLDAVEAVWSAGAAGP
jgi:hypothetical protein